MGDRMEHDSDDDAHDSSGPSLDQRSNMDEGKNEADDAFGEDPASGENLITAGGSGVRQARPTSIQLAIQNRDDAKVAGVLALAGKDKGTDIIMTPYSPRWTNGCPDLESGTGPFLHIAKRGSLAMMNSVMAYSKVTRAQSVLNVRDHAGTTFLLEAVKNENPEVFEEALRLVEREFETTEQRSFIEGKDKDGETLLSAAVQTGNIKTFVAALNCVWDSLGHHQRCGLIESKNKKGDGMFSPETPRAFSQKLWSKSLESGHLGLFESMIAVVPEQHRTKLKADGPTEGDTSLLWWALSYDEDKLWGQVVECSKEHKKVAENHPLDDVLAACIRKAGKDHEPAKSSSPKLNTIFSLMSSYAPPSSDGLKLLFRIHSSDEDLPQRCLSAVTSATNPFITGMNLSVALTKAAETAVEAERRKLLDTETRVDALLLEIFKHLPDTVRGFHGGMDGCVALFEPSFMLREGKDPTALIPLTQMFAARKQAETFCSVPLVMDFLSRRFTLGLPNLTDSDEVLKDSDKLRFLDTGQTDGEEHHLVVRSVKSNLNDYQWLTFGWIEYPLTMLQGASDKVPRLTVLPGVQFVLAGLIATPTSYYRVPATRMALDVVLYAYFIIVVSIAVLFQEDGLLSPGNHHVYVAFLFVVGGLLREVMEIKGGVSKYFEDRWNFFDLPGLLFLTAGMITKLALGDEAYPVAKALFALSAPLLVSRILFFAQLLRVQGLMIQVIFSMVKLLLQFGVVMGVVMIGFAMSFYVLFEESESFGETFLSLFNAMFGDADFDAFSGGPHDLVATILLVAYIVVMTIVLLNLLVAVLSTSHARVQGNNEREFKLLQAGMFKHYRRVVQNDTLPAPFNLVRLVVKLCGKIVAGCVSTGDRCRPQETLGRVIFTLFMGPLAVAAGAILWFVSCPFALWQLHKHSRGGESAGKRHAGAAKKEEEGGGNAENVGPPNSYRYLIVFTWCVLGAPLSLACLFVLRLVGLFVPCAGSNGCAREGGTQASPRQGGTSQPSARPEEDWKLRIMELLFPNKAFRLAWADDGDGAPGGGSIKQGSTNTIEAMLTAAPGGAGAEDLQSFLDNPLGETAVRADEKERKATLQHVKLLRQRLEQTSKKELREVKVMIEDLRSVMDERFRRLDQILSGQAGGDEQKSTSGDVPSS
ncbi:unnamed protein product [Scytosiphon promiscuus]